MISILFFKQKTAYEVRISDWSSDVCSSDLISAPSAVQPPDVAVAAGSTASSLSPDENHPANHNQPPLTPFFDLQTMPRAHVTGPVTEPDAVDEAIFKAALHVLRRKARAGHGPTTPHPHDKTAPKTPP